MRETMKEVVRERYSRAALDVLDDRRASCCGGAVGIGASCCGEAVEIGAGGGDAITRDLYDAVTASELPAAAVLASLGCGNPTALAELHEGETVLDLGSGGGIDVLLSARRVGPTGKAYGVDMTDEMLELARKNQREAGVGNVEFLKGEIEAIPLPDESVDVVISNCVINLSVDKAKVIRESFRVLRPGGRFAVSDIVTRGEMPDDVRRSAELWAGCVAGALDETEFAHLLREAGFEDVEIEPTRVYSAEDARELIGGDASVAFDGRLMAAFVRGRKPAVA
ncbi:MAG: arsenite methyltransferase [Longimicrobiales bacterium]